MKLKVSSIILLQSGEKVETSFSNRELKSNLAKGKRLLFLNHRYFKTNDIKDILSPNDEATYIEVKYGEGMFVCDKIQEIFYPLMA